MSPQEFQECVKIAEQDQAINGYRKTHDEYIDLIIQCYEVLKRCK